VGARMAVGLAVLAIAAWISPAGLIAATDASVRTLRSLGFSGAVAFGILQVLVSLSGILPASLFRWQPVGFTLRCRRARNYQKRSTLRRRIYSIDISQRRFQAVYGVDVARTTIMTTFLPLKRYMFHCLDQFIEHYNVQPPFLDIGCGTGDLCVYLGTKGWNGKGIDFSLVAISEARDRLIPFPNLVAEEQDLFDETDSCYCTIFLWDIIEHIENDKRALEKAASLLVPRGAILIAVPSNPREWRWDAEMVGHYRRYTMVGLTALLREVGLEPLEFWDFTFPVFWAMRRGYTWLKPKPDGYENSLEERTKASASSCMVHPDCCRTSQQ
jgi:SAM-dependent methyltransferase